ncbi:MAG: DUF4388 domain-containing protein, partial [Myxococcota bacterium]
VGVEAVYRMLLWEDGVFELEFKPVARKDLVGTSTQAILLEGMRRVDEWSKFAAQVPPLSTRLALDYAALTRAFPNTSDAMQAVLHLFDGRRTLLEVIDDAPMTDIEALEIISHLHGQGILYAADRPASGVPRPRSSNALIAWPQVGKTAEPSEVEEWLHGNLPDFPASASVPSALIDATIPSSRTPSEILGATIPIPDVVDAATSAPQPKTSSIVLSRHIVPADQPVPMHSAPPSDRPPTDTIDMQRPTLTLKRMSSVLEAPRTSDFIGEASRSPTPTTLSSMVDHSPTVPDRQSTHLMRPAWEQVYVNAEIVPPSLALPEMQSSPTRRVLPKTSESAPITEPAGVPPLPRNDELMSADRHRPPAALDHHESSPLPEPSPTPDRSEAYRATPSTEPAGDPPLSSASPANDVDPIIAEPAQIQPFAPTGSEALALHNDALTLSSTNGVDGDETSRSFFEPAKSEVDIDWEADGQAWQQRVPAILLMATVVLVAIVLFFGGSSRKEVAQQETEVTEAVEWPAAVAEREPQKPAAAEPQKPAAEPTV